MSATGSCFDQQTPMLSVEQAAEELLRHARAPQASERVELLEAAGRVLARDVRARADVPGFDNSAMDGYALRASDIETARAEGLNITQRIAAGETGEPLPAAAAARIFTGAPLPPGADTVAMQEHCGVREGRLYLDDALVRGANVRPRGNDISAGSTVIRAGTLLGAAHVGLAASVGISHIEAFRRVRVAMFSTGDELVEPGDALAPGQIYNSNRYLLNALLRARGCTVVDLGRAADTLEATRQLLLAGAEQADLVLTTGGVSVGEEDHVKAALESVGRLTLWRIRMKPGKPLAFGRVGETPFIGLPGNPVSVFVTFLLFARPFLQMLQGCGPGAPHAYAVRAGFNYSARQRREYVRVRLREDPVHGPVAEAYPRQGSDVLSSVAWADGLVEIAETATIRDGDRVRFLPFAEWTP